MSISSLRKFFAAAALAVCLPFVSCAAASATPTVTLPDFTTLVDKVGPSVVNIRTTSRVGTSSDLRGLPPGMDEGDMSDFFRRFFGIPMPGQPGGAARRRW